MIYKLTCSEIASLKNKKGIAYTRVEFEQFKVINSFVLSHNFVEVYESMKTDGECHRKIGMNGRPEKYSLVLSLHKIFIEMSN